MKKILVLSLFIGIFLSSCMPCGDKNTLSETIRTEVYITNVNVYKYSKIQGYIIYKGIKLEIDNGNSGYYHKKYYLKSGDVIQRTVTIYLENTYQGDPYKQSVIISTGDVNFSDYEIKRY